MFREDTRPGGVPTPRDLSEAQHFIARWLRQNLPPFYREFSVVELAARLRREASDAGIDLSEVERVTPLAIEQIIMGAVHRRVVP